MIHLFPITQARAVPRITAEAHALFIARHAVTMGATMAASDTLKRALDQLGRSSNAAVATEANRLKASAQ